MILICEKCFTKYEVPAEMIGPAGRTVKCTNCSHSWLQQPMPGDNADSPLPQSMAVQKVAVKPQVGLIYKLVFTLCLLVFICSSGLYLFAGGNFGGKFDKIKNIISLNDVSGFEIKNVAFKKVVDNNGKYIFLVSGQIVNGSKVNKLTPAIRISILDENGSKMASLGYTLEAKKIRVGEALLFEPKINNVPAEAATITVDVANNLEILFRK